MAQLSGSETEGKKLGAAGSVTVYKRSEANLVGDTGARKPFCDDANQDTQHCCSAVEQFYAFELFQ